MSLLNFAADLARIRAAQPTRVNWPADFDHTERGIHTVLDVVADFAAARKQAELKARLEQLRERVENCILALEDEERQLTLAINAWPASRCYVSATDYRQHFEEGA